VSVHYYRQWGWDWALMVPGRDDVAALVQAVKRMLVPLTR
jgi:hypothetical protein